MHYSLSCPEVLSRFELGGLASLSSWDCSLLSSLSLLRVLGPKRNVGSGSVQTVSSSFASEEFMLRRACLLRVRTVFVTAAPIRMREAETCSMTCAGWADSPVVSFPSSPDNGPTENKMGRCRPCFSLHIGLGAERGCPVFVPSWKGCLDVYSV